MPKTRFRNLQTTKKEITNLSIPRFPSMRAIMHTSISTNGSASWPQGLQFLGNIPKWIVVTHRFPFAIFFFLLLLHHFYNLLFLRFASVRWFKAVRIANSLSKRSKWVLVNWGILFGLFEMWICNWLLLPYHVLTQIQFYVAILASGKRSDRCTKLVPYN